MSQTDVRAREYRAKLAPGTPLRSGLERILRGRTGALVVIGQTDVIRRISTGGFVLDTPFTPTALRELAKMDGAIILSSNGDRILAAGIQLMPDADLGTEETGTRHRTADRVAQQSGCPVVTVSASMNTISLFLDDRRYPIEAPGAILSRANLALQTLERYRARLQQILLRLSVLEVQDQVTVQDLVLLAQRLEMVRRLEQETAGYVTELGTDGRLIELQLLEVNTRAAELSDMLTSDYRPDGVDDFGFDRTIGLLDSDLADLALVARTIGFGGPLEGEVSPRGYRQLASVQRLPQTVVQRLIDHFDGLQGILGASSTELRQVEGVGGHRARALRDFLTQLTESSYAQPPE